MTAALAPVLGALLAVGVVLVVAGLRPREQRVEPARAGRRRDWVARAQAMVRRHGLALGLGVVGGMALTAFTGLVVMLVAVPCAAVGLPMLLSAPANRDIELLQALDKWVRGLAAMLPTGRSVVDSIRASVRNAPEPLARSLVVLVARLDDRWTASEALRAMADELDSPDADAVLAALSLAAARGGTGATATLNGLADSIQERLKAQREIEAERAKPRIVVRQVTIVTLSVLTMALLFGRGFFEPYGSPVGQLILTVLLAAYVASLVVLRRMTTPRRRDRILRGVR